MLQFYLHHFYLYDKNYTVGEIDTLMAIANLCPIQGGKAVYRARAALRWFNANLEYYDDIMCLTSSSRKAGLQQNEIKVLLNGNPLCNASELIFSQTLPEDYELSVYSVQGQLINTFDLPVNTTKYSLVKLNLSYGLYLLKIFAKDHALIPIKLSVQ